MRYLCALLAIVCSVPTARGDGQTLQEARQRLLRDRLIVHAQIVQRHEQRF